MQSKFAVNLSTVFTEYPFLERFKKAKEFGFQYVECQFPYQYSLLTIEKELKNNELSLVLINLSPGNWKNEDRGLAIDPDRTTEFKRSVDEGIHYATKLNCKQIHCMAGIIPGKLTRKMARETYISNIIYAASKMLDYQITLLIEPINPFDIPNYFLADIRDAINIINEINLPNVRLQFDFYHMKRIHDNLLTTFAQYKNYISHVQIADHPGRHEPGTGGIDYNQIFKFLHKNKYKGFIGLEYTPSKQSAESFSWIDTLGRR